MDKPKPALPAKLAVGSANAAKQIAAAAERRKNGVSGGSDTPAGEMSDKNAKRKAGGSLSTSK